MDGLGREEESCGLEQLKMTWAQCPLPRVVEPTRAKEAGGPKQARPAAAGAWAPGPCGKFNDTHREPN